MNRAVEQLGENSGEKKELKKLDEASKPRSGLSHVK